MDNKENKVKSFSVEIGFYPGILLGARTYEEPEQTAYVLYIPFIDLAVTVYN